MSEEKSSKIVICPECSGRGIRKNSKRVFKKCFYCAGFGVVIETRRVTYTYEQINRDPS